jgi:hypothetical protein
LEKRASAKRLVHSCCFKSDVNSGMPGSARAAGRATTLSLQFIEAPAVVAQVVDALDVVRREFGEAHPRAQAIHPVASAFSSASTAVSAREL